MSGIKKRVAAVEGWFEMDGAEPHLLGSRCAACRTYFFPPESFFCRNPGCRSTDFETVPLSRRGTLWSFTDSRYRPPAPYVSAEPFEPYAIAAVALDAERMVVLGQVVTGVGVGELRAGMPMELVLGTLYEDEAHEYVVWKWRPVGVESAPRSP
jgi:hypothetical protein